MTVAYARDRTTKIVAINTETAVDAANLHDSFGRYFVPDGQPFRVLFECMGQTKVVASGVSKGGPGKLCPIRIKVRIEPPSDEPLNPALEVIS